MGARYYNPALGRFLSIDPVEPDENNLHSLNRYAYANNNPYKFTDPDGQAAETVIDVISLGLSLNAYRQDPGFINGLALAYDGLATAVPFLPGGIGIIRQAATKGSDVTQALKQAADKGAAKASSKSDQVFERVVSNAELKATQQTGMLRGGKEGENFFTNSASLDAKRAHQRLGLDGPLRDARIRFKITDDMTVSGPRSAAPGRSGTTGGGREFSTKEKTRIEIIRVDPLRK